MTVTLRPIIWRCVVNIATNTCTFSTHIDSVIIRKQSIESGGHCIGSRTALSGAIFGALSEAFLSSHWGGRHPLQHSGLATHTHSVAHGEASRTATHRDVAHTHIRRPLSFQVCRLVSIADRFARNSPLLSVSLALPALSQNGSWRVSYLPPRHPSPASPSNPNHTAPRKTHPAHRLVNGC